VESAVVAAGGGEELSPILLVDEVGGVAVVIFQSSVLVNGEL
jgi:hypothetical protein